MAQHVSEPTIVVRGDVPGSMVAYAREKLLAMVARASVPVLAVELRLDHHADPARQRPDHVEITIDLDGTAVRARRSAPTMSEAIDRTLTRLRRRVESASERLQTRRLRHRGLESWHHGDRPATRPHIYPRRVEDRKLVRRKTFALHAESIDEALYDLESLDHDFFLFVHDETGAEAVVHHVGEGHGLMQRVPTPEAIARVEIPLDLGPSPATMTLENALTVLDETDAPFTFFVDAESGRAVVAYRRYDGDYGLIVPT
jgi:ribosome-associated translation inhibitor RaiA